MLLALKPPLHSSRMRTGFCHILHVQISTNVYYLELEVHENQTLTIGWEVQMGSADKFFPEE